MRVAGIDTSLTSTGVAIVRHDGTGELHRIQSTGKATATLQERRARLNTLADQVSALVLDCGLVVIEQPAYSRTTGSMHDRSGLWWLVVNRIAWNMARLDHIVEVAPSVRPKYATGSGTAGKDAVLAAVVRRYASWDVDGNDVADALVLAAMGKRWAGEPIDTLPKVNVATLSAVRWPEVAA